MNVKMTGQFLPSTDTAENITNVIVLEPISKTVILSAGYSKSGEPVTFDLEIHDGKKQIQPYIIVFKFSSFLS